MAMLLVGIPCSVVGQQIHGTAPVLWERFFGGQRLPFTQVAMAVSPGSAQVWICASTPGDGGTGMPDGFELWRISKDGKILHRGSVPNAWKGKPLDFAVAIRPSIAALDDGGSLLILRSNMDQTLLLRFDEKGQLVRARDLALSPTVVISKIVTRGNNSYLLLGSQGEDAFATSIDEHGNELWQNTFDRGRVESFVTAVATAGEEWILVGSSYPVEGPFDPKASQIFLIKCDGLGRKKSEHAFEGSMPSACRAGNENLTVVYYKPAEPSAELWIENMDNQLQSLWAEKISSIEFPILPFHVAPTSSGGFVVAGTKAPRFWMVGLNQQGKQVWSYQDTREAIASVTCLGLTASAEWVFVLTSVLSLENPQAPAHRLGLIKVRP